MVDFWREPGSVYSVFMLEDVASDKRLSSGVCYLFHGALGVLQKGLTVGEKSPGLGLFGKSGAGRRQQRFAFFPSSILGENQVYLVDGRIASSSQRPTTCLCSDVLSMLGFML